MMKRKLGTTGLEVSVVGIGGHYRAMEEGMYEDRTAYIDREVALRCRIVERAFERGITYFDTTWKNEAELLGLALKQTGLRDRVVVNGMVLGSFTGSKASGMTVEDYFGRWLDCRLSLFPGGHFDTFMVNAIEEGYDEAGCERLVRYLEKRRSAGDFKAFGFSCHDPMLARRVADKFPEFQTIMIPYNYLNRRFEEAFDGIATNAASETRKAALESSAKEAYAGSAAFIAMKPLVWAEYGVPFCALNHFSSFRDLFGFEKVPDIATSAFRFVLGNRRVTTVISAVNTTEEVDQLANAAKGHLSEDDGRMLEAYRTAQAGYGGIPLFLSAMRGDNLRKNYYGVINLSRVLGVDMPVVSLNEIGAREKLLRHGEQLRRMVEDRKILPVIISVEQVISKKSPM